MSKYRRELDPREPREAELIAMIDAINSVRPKGYIAVDVDRETSPTRYRLMESNPGYTKKYTGHILYESLLIRIKKETLPPKIVCIECGQPIYYLVGRFKNPIQSDMFIGIPPQPTPRPSQAPKCVHCGAMPFKRKGTSSRVKAKQENGTFLE